MLIIPHSRKLLYSTFDQTSKQDLIFLFSLAFQKCKVKRKLNPCLIHQSGQPHHFEEDAIPLLGSPQGLI